ncbi:MAG: hypothetical protein GX757_03895 [Clostridiales bacterium]|nr:hypothetical protein [Clostridiales bacterium]
MQNNIVYNLSMMGPYILTVVVFMIAFAMVSLLLIRNIRWKSGLIKVYGLFIGMKSVKQFALAAILLRLLFIWYLAFYNELDLVHIIYGAIITILIHLLLADLSILPFDLICMVLMFAELYIGKILGLYIKNTKTDILLIAGYIAISVCVLVTSVYCMTEHIISLVNVRKSKKLGANLTKRLYFILAGLFVAAVPYIYINQIDIYQTDQEVYQYTAAGKTTYPAKSRISKTEDIGIIEQDKELIALDKTPLYFTEDDALMLTSVYSIIQPNLALTNRVGINSIIYLDDDGTYYVDNSQAKVRVSDFFLFDGKDTYIFFEPTEISWDENAIEISPFSYVTVKSNRSIEFFDRASESYRVIETGVSYVYAKLGKGSSINMSSDILIRSNGQEQFLFLQPNLLEDLK